MLTALLTSAALDTFASSNTRTAKLTNPTWDYRKPPRA
jgi:hypothetical protein